MPEAFYSGEKGRLQCLSVPFNALQCSFRRMRNVGYSKTSFQEEGHVSDCMKNIQNKGKDLCSRQPVLPAHPLTQLMV